MASIDYEHAMSLRTEGLESAYGWRETMLYALGVGFGRDPMDERELPFVYEGTEDPDFLMAAPSMAGVLQWGKSPVLQVGANRMMMVHGEQRITLHQPLPSAAELVGEERIIGCYDKGREKGALLVAEKSLRLKATGAPLCTIVSSYVARGDGGFGGPASGAPRPHPIPDRRPDGTLRAETRIDQPFLFALSGDTGALHRDPKFSIAAGFPKPILHGMCTSGSVCRAILAGMLDYDPSRVAAFDVRFSAPMLPGETILVDVWSDGDVISFRARPEGRDAVAIDNGRCVVTPG